MQKIYHSLLLLFLSGFLLSQTNSYQSLSNPQYWKNRKPFEGYWQQDVHYTIKANVDEKKNIVTATENLVYWNNSPDELPYVFFHLYQNAFQPESYNDKLHKANKTKVIFGKYENAKKGTEVLSIKINGQEVKTELDNTILKVYLPAPLKSGESVSFDIEFKTYFDNGSMRRRMKTFRSSGYKHFDGVHWYPRISVYDRKFGWDTDQHLGKEFYGDYGVYDVELTFANNYVMDATGLLMNANEVMPDSLRKKLDIANFKDKPWEEKASVIIPYDSTYRKTWKFHAENVHDFAWTADPTYRIGETEWNGVKCIALVQEPHAALWQNAAEYTAKIIKTFSQDFGMYIYPKMIVADARDGMEYPMLTLDGGYDPEYRGLLVHEIGHNWFYGMVGNNETYRACLDEGFTQFLTAWGLEVIDGDTIQEDEDENWYKRLFRKKELARQSKAYNGYIYDAMKEEDATLNTHSDDFGNALGHGGGYRHVYYKTATMLYNLQYVLGDELFSKAMKNYFSQWKVAHPYPEDFRNSMIHYTKMDLNWFFDQWMETTKYVDYSIDCVKKEKEENTYTITFKREGTMQMPVDFQVLSKDDKTYNFYIPNTWYEKSTEARKLPRWIGWGKLNPTYKATVFVPGGLKDVTIDPSGRLADVNRLDNTTKCNTSIEFDHKIYNAADPHKYQLFARPELWYNGYDGIKAGIHVNGNYMKTFGIIDFTVWYNTGILQQDAYVNTNTKDAYDLFSYRFKYKTYTKNWIKGSEINLESRFIDGLVANRLGFNFPLRNNKTTFGIFYNSLYRARSTDLLYLMYPTEWNADSWNNTINVQINHQYKFTSGVGKFMAGLKSSALGSDYSYSALQVESVTKINWRKIKMSNRFFAQLGMGSNWAPESQLFLAGANPEQLMDNKYTRSVGFNNVNWMGFGNNINHFQQGGGLNLRGYAGYLAPELSNGEVQFSYKGMSGAAVNSELDFTSLIPIKLRRIGEVLDIKTYLFGDIGMINAGNNNNKFYDFRADAGAGAALTIQKFGPLELVNPLVIRADFPLFLNAIPASEIDYIQFRWVVGINRAF